MNQSFSISNDIFNFCYFQCLVFVAAQRPPPRVVEQVPISTQVEMEPRAKLLATEAPVKTEADPVVEAEDDYDDAWQHMTEELLNSFFPETETETDTKEETTSTRPEPLMALLVLNETANSENQSNKTLGGAGEAEEEVGENQTLSTSGTTTEFAALVTGLTTNTPVVREEISEVSEVRVLPGQEDPTTSMTPITSASTTSTPMVSTSTSTQRPEIETPPRGYVYKCPRCNYEKRAEVLTQHLNVCYDIIRVRKSLILFLFLCLFV